MTAIEKLRQEIEGFERDIAEDKDGGWVLGDAHEALQNMRARLWDMEKRETREPARSKQ